MDDLISRSDAIGAVKEERFPIDSDYAEGFMAALDKVEWILKEWLPSAQPERKTGRWILSDTQWQEDVDNGNYQFICSEYGKADIHSKAVVVSFCWNCGARMEDKG